MRRFIVWAGAWVIASILSNSSPAAASQVPDQKRGLKNARKVIKARLQHYKRVEEAKAKAREKRRQAN